MKLKIYKHRGGWHWKVTNKGRILAKNARPYSTIKTAEKAVGAVTAALNDVGPRRSSTPSVREYVGFGAQSRSSDR